MIPMIFEKTMVCDMLNKLIPLKQQLKSSRNFLKYVKLRNYVNVKEDPFRF